MIEIEEVKEPGFLGIGSDDDFVYRQKHAAVPLRKYEETLLTEMFGGRDEVKLSDLKNKFYKVIPALRKELYQAVVEEGYFERSPESVRSQYAGLGVLALVLTACISFLAISTFAQLSGYVVCLPVGLGVIGLGIIILSRYMPRRTPAGADAVARWRAFKRYLENLEKYTKVEDATEIFDRYLPYAVAFGARETLDCQVRQGGCAAPALVDPLWLSQAVLRGRLWPGHRQRTPAGSGGAHAERGQSTDPERRVQGHGRLPCRDERRPRQHVIFRFPYLDQLAFIQRRRRAFLRRWLLRWRVLGRRWLLRRRWRRRWQQFRISVGAGLVPAQNGG